MDLLTNHLHSMRKQLPDAQRDDIAAELRDTLLSQIEARESELGRPLTVDEHAAMLGPALRADCDADGRDDRHQCGHHRQAGMDGVANVDRFRGYRVV